MSNVSGEQTIDELIEASAQTFKPRGVMIGGMIVALANLLVKGLVTVRDTPDGFMMDLTGAGIRELKPHIWAELLEWAEYWSDDNGKMQPPETCDADCGAV